MRLIEVAVVSILILFILILGVVMVRKVFANEKAVAMFHQTTYAYAMFSYTELQLQGKARPLVSVPTTTVGVSATIAVIPTPLRFFGVLISDLPTSTNYDWVMVDNTYYGFDDYGGKGAKPGNPKWISYTGVMKSVSRDFTTVVYGKGTLYDLMSPDAYLVDVLPVFSKRTYANFTEFYVRAFGSYTVTARHETYVVWKYGVIPETLYFYPSSSVGTGYVTDNTFGSATVILFTILRSLYPFNTMNTLEEFYYEPLNTGQNVVVVKSKLALSTWVDGFYLANGSLTNGSTVEINGNEYTILPGSLSVFSIRKDGISGSVELDIYYGKIKIEKPSVNWNTVFKQRATVITVSPPLWPGYTNIELLELYFKPVEVKILEHKKHLIFTVKEGIKYSVLSSTFN